MDDLRSQTSADLSLGSIAMERLYSFLRFIFWMVVNYLIPVVKLVAGLVFDVLWSVLKCLAYWLSDVVLMYFNTPSVSNRHDAKQKPGTNTETDSYPIENLYCDEENQVNTVIDSRSSRCDLEDILPVVPTLPKSSSSNFCDNHDYDLPVVNAISFESQPSSPTVARRDFEDIQTAAPALDWSYSDDWSVKDYHDLPGSDTIFFDYQASSNRSSSDDSRDKDDHDLFEIDTMFSDYQASSYRERANRGKFQKVAPTVARRHFEDVQTAAPALDWSYLDDWSVKDYYDLPGSDTMFSVYQPSSYRLRANLGKFQKVAPTVARSHNMSSVNQEAGKIETGTNFPSHLHKKVSKSKRKDTKQNSDTSTGHVHQDKSDAPICSDYLLGKCNKGVKCPGHHCSLPFHWQYKVPDADEWKSFSETDNETLEKLYCDVMLEDCSASSLQTSFQSFDGEYNLTFLLDDMLMMIQKRFVDVMAEIRRLSTESHVSNPGSPVASVWTWYWKDENEMWREYGVDHLGRDLQRSIEEEFLKNTNRFKFRISDQDYKLYFNSTTEMHQKNLRYGTTRKVRRRPAKFKSKADIRELKRSHNMSSAKQLAGKNATGTNVPSHWSSMPSDKQHKRVPMTATSSEFKEIETLFKKTIKKTVVINSIERVQNPFMWGKYQRKKENMLAIKTGGHKLNEKRLFHGTSADTVEAICKQNFDWRLHGKNATKYGQGSYFALNSSYSDAYAKKDANSSRFMFVAKVLVGSYTKGHSSYRRPPQKDPSNPASDLYDSCVDDRSNPTIFVVFDTDQFYPEYIIKYSPRA